MKIDENLAHKIKSISDDDLFFSSIFTLRASPPEADKPEACMPFGLQLTAPTLLKARNSALWLRL
jgi:hypothetical protein